MQRIDTRTQLINAIRNGIGMSAVSRACVTGTVEVLGGFSRIPPMPLPGWVVMITSIHGQTWLIAVTPDDHRHVFNTGLIESAPWRYYVGRDGGCSIYDGDDPEQACIAREQAR